jgi:hypothetical protein
MSNIETNQETVPFKNLTLSIDINDDVEASTTDGSTVTITRKFGLGSFTLTVEEFMEIKFLLDEADAIQSRPRGR